MFKRSSFSLASSARSFLPLAPRGTLAGNLGRTTLSLRNTLQSFSTLAETQLAVAACPAVLVNIGKYKDALLPVSNENTSIILHRLYAHDHHHQFHIHRPQVHRYNEWSTLLNTVEKILFWVTAILTLGLSIVFYYKPLLDYRHHKRAINKMVIDGRRLHFTGEFAEYRSIYFKNALLSFITFGFYAVWNQPELNFANYLDSHITWADANQEKDHK